MNKKQFDILINLLNKREIDLNSEKALRLLYEFKKVIK